MGRLAEAAQARRAATIEAVRDDTIIGKLIASLNDEDRSDLLGLLADIETWPASELAPFIGDMFPEIPPIQRELLSKWRREKLSRWL